MNHFFGIDYGSKVAGTTSICRMNNDGKLDFATSVKGRDADLWIKKMIEAHTPEKVYIDAPLSLPGAYYGKDSNYFYRQADRDLRAMSPMFLGGLTARAIKLRSELSLPFLEVYPAGLVDHLHLSSHYDKKSNNITVFLDVLGKRVELPALTETPANWHEVDALLCWITGQRHSNHEAIAYGRPDEGQIWV